MAMRDQDHPRRILLEVCIASADDAEAAAAGGAGRLELNTALALGGLTPSAGLVAEVLASVALPVIVMIRPRAGGFCYGDAEWRTMRRDAAAALDAGAAGVAFGALTADGRVDAARCREMVRHVEPAEAVFHRAFDVTPDPAEALERLIDAGVRRVMTSGQAPTALEGAALIAGLIEQARGRIEVLPAAGINPRTVAAVVGRTGCDQVHASLRTRRVDPSTAARPQIRFGGDDGYEATNGEAVAEMVRLLKACGRPGDAAAL